jgi:hypothetical protein
VRNHGRFRCRDKLFGPRPLREVSHWIILGTGRGGRVYSTRCAEVASFLRRLRAFLSALRTGPARCDGGPAARLAAGFRDGPGCSAAARCRPSPAVQLIAPDIAAGVALAAAPPRGVVVVSRAGLRSSQRSAQTHGSRTRKNRAEGEQCPIVCELARGSGRAETLRTIIELLREHSRVALARGLGYCACARRPSSINSTRSRSPG